MSYRLTVMAHSDTDVRMKWLFRTFGISYFSLSAVICENTELAPSIGSVTKCHKAFSQETH